MAWEIGISKQAERFLRRHHLSDSFAVKPTQRAIQKLRGETVTADIKRLSGKWEGCFRVRLGKNRIIFSTNFEKQTVLVEVIDSRGNVYK